MAIKTTLREKADKLLATREDLYEMHFHKVDREWIIDAMVDFAENNKVEISDDEIEREAEYYFPLLGESSKKNLWKMGAKWYKQRLKSKK